MNILNELYIVAGAIPAFVFYVMGLVTGILVMIEEDDYQSCLNLGSSGDEHIKGHLRGSAAWGLGFTLVYGQMVFKAFDFLYIWSGIVMSVGILAGLAIHILNAIWFVESDCDDTIYYRLAMANTILFFTLVGLMVIAIVVLLIIMCCRRKKNATGPSELAEEKEEAEEESKKPMVEEEKNEEAENKKEEEEEVDHHDYGEIE